MTPGTPSDGIIVVREGHLLDAATVSLPPGVHAVVVDSGAGNGFSVTHTDQADGARQAVEHLLGPGHRTVWHAAGLSASFASERRVNAWRSVPASRGWPEPALLRGD